MDLLKYLLVTLFGINIYFLLPLSTFISEHTIFASIFLIIWNIIIFFIFFARNSLTRKLYIGIKECIYSNYPKEKIFSFCAFILLSFFLITLLYFCRNKNENENIKDFLGFFSSVVTIGSIPSLFSWLFAEKQVEKRNAENKSTYSSPKNLDEVMITRENSRGISTFVRAINSANKNAVFILENNKLIVNNYLGNLSGDNLWYEMNEWFYSNGKIGKNHPLINAQENNWHGNDAWATQLDEFISYLRKNNKLEESDKTNKTEEL